MPEETRDGAEMNGESEGLRRSLYSSIAAQWISAALAIASSLAIARLLTPAELGVFGVAMALLLLLQTIQNIGMAEFLLYAEQVDTEIRRAAFGLVVAVSTLLAVAVVAISEPAARFYGSPGVADVLRIAALNIMISVLTMPISSMLTRRSEFRVIGAIAVVSNIVLSLLQVGLAWAGWSYQALAWAMVGSTVVSVILLFAIRPQYILLRPSFTGASRMLDFGGKLFAVNVVNQIYNAAPQIMIGYTNGLSAVAMYGRANTLFQIYLQTISRAIDPVISSRLALEQRGGGSAATVLVTTSRALFVFSAAFFGFAAIYADILVPLLFGGQWLAAIVPMRILSLGFMIAPLTSPIGALLLSVGQPGTLLRIRVVNTVARIALVLAVARFGLSAIAAAVLVSTYLNLIQSLLATRKVAGIRLRTYVGGLGGSTLVAGVSLICAWLAPLLLVPAGTAPMIVLMIASVAAGVSWLAMLAATRHVIWIEFLHLAGTLRRRAGRRRSTDAARPELAETTE